MENKKLNFKKVFEIFLNILPDYDLLKKYIDIDYLKDCENFKEFAYKIDDMVSNASIVYYSNAIKFLSKYDPSLEESINLAVDLGYDMKDLNSELMASLLLQEILKEDLYNLYDDLRRDLLFELIYSGDYLVSKYLDVNNSKYAYYYDSLSILRNKIDELEIYDDDADKLKENMRKELDVIENIVYNSII